MKDKEEEIRLFEPSDRDMKTEYPELADTKEFEGLSTREMKFVWYYSNQTSPIAHYKEQTRADKAISLSYGVLQGRKELKDWRRGVFPENIRLAIDRMSSYSISFRLRARLNTEHIFDNLMSMTTKSNSELDTLEMDEQKKYSDLAIKVASEMPKLIESIEMGYGVKKIVNKKNKKADIKVGISNLGL